MVIGAITPLHAPWDRRLFEQRGPIFVGNLIWRLRFIMTPLLRRSPKYRSKSQIVTIAMAIIAESTPMISRCSGNYIPKTSKAKKSKRF
jgi:hypothetical protein